MENNGGTGSSFSGLNDADSPESNIRYKMIAKNIPSSNEFIIAIQKYDDFTSWENTLANKRLLTTTTILDGGNTLVIYDNGSGVSETLLGNRPGGERGAAITFHNLEYTQWNTIPPPDILLTNPGSDFGYMHGAGVSANIDVNYVAYYDSSTLVTGIIHVGYLKMCLVDLNGVTLTTATSKYAGSGNVPTTRDELISIYDSGNGPHVYGTYVFTAGGGFDLSLF